MTKNQNFQRFKIFKNSKLLKIQIFQKFYIFRKFKIFKKSKFSKIKIMNIEKKRKHFNPHFKYDDLKKMLKI